MSKRTIHQANASEYLNGLNEQSPTIFLANVETLYKRCKAVQIRNSLFDFVLTRARAHMAKKEYSLAFELLEQLWNESFYTPKQGVKLAALSVETAVTLANPISHDGASDPMGRSYYSEAAVLLDNANTTRAIPETLKTQIAEVSLPLSQMALCGKNVMAAHALMQYAYDYEDSLDPSWDSNRTKAYTDIANTASKLGGYDNIALDCLERAETLTPKNSNLETKTKAAISSIKYEIEAGVKKSPRLLDVLTLKVAKEKALIADFGKLA